MGPGTPNAWARERERRPDALDLTDTNPASHGLTLPEVGECLARAARDARHRPDPRGPRAAREALAARFGGGPEEYWLTASTSEAYSWLFQLLAAPGEPIAAPQPSYPLLEPLAQLAGLDVRSYWTHHLDPDGWVLDGATLTAAVRPGAASARAVVVVSPGNPTGAFSPLGVIAEVAGTVPLIVDQVFEPFRLDAPAAAPQPSRVGPAAGAAGFDPVGSRGSQPLGSMGPAAVAAPLDAAAALGEPPPGCVWFVLDGVSKRLAAPGAKIGWIRVIAGASVQPEVGEALDRVADSYLSVSAASTAALPALLELEGEAVRVARHRALGNLTELRKRWPWRVRRCEAGWVAMVDAPARGPRAGDEDLATWLLRERGLAVHPGWFYGVPGERALVLSLLGRPQAFADAVARLVRAVAEFSD
ncbi:MAG: pyridoxal phosphate-dependent aminotransferase [Bifidobacteriaceae bacterium]|nr:pyridoxal phosphate-dependent aminotransferase [Bifidobacteriaceae bacterium]